ncbi:MAG: AtpZ/AtpI family protein [Acetobacterium sp.]|nr:AtpZ/AtpI family protein [uncultured Acetobacterium sp.]MBU4440061.1 AtpZ/AtpI family protein [Bacillota bacterium]MCG2729562.1 AtpZ/AtpI family protein [Acetobacterium sp.]
MGPKKESPFKYLVILPQIGISVFVPIALMFFVAKGLEYFFHTGPVVFIICIVLGILTGLKILYDLPMKMNNESMAYNKRRLEEYEKKENENKENGDEKNEND